MGGLTVVDARAMDGETATVDGHELRSFLAEPPIRPAVHLAAPGKRELRTAR